MRYEPTTGMAQSRFPASPRKRCSERSHSAVENTSGEERASSIKDKAKPYRGAKALGSLSEACGRQGVTVAATHPKGWRRQFGRIRTNNEASDANRTSLTVERAGPRALEFLTDGDVGVREVLGERIEGGVVPPFREPTAAADSIGRIQKRHAYK